MMVGDRERGGDDEERSEDDGQEDEGTPALAELG